MVPDSVGLIDLVRSDAADVMEVLARRADDGRMPLRRATLRWPKSFDLTAWRGVTHLDRVDQLAYRVQVGRCARQVERNLAGTVVAHRFAFTDGAWRSLGILEGWGRRKDSLLPRFLTDPSLWLATMDVRSYYPSLNIDTVARALNTVGIDAGIVEGVTGFVTEVNGLPGRTAGLPVGPEGSSVLGTVGLVAIDRAAGAANYVRLADDLWHVAGTESDAYVWTEMIRERLALLDLCDSPAKLKC